MRFVIVWLVLVGLSGCSQIPRSYLQQSTSASSQADSKNLGVASQCGAKYTVKKNDALSLIAQKCKVSMQQVARLNDLKPPYVLYPGQELTLPSGSTIQAENHVKASQTSGLDWVWPVKNYQNFRFVKGSNGLNGLEVYAEKGSLVHAVEEGEVVFADNSLSNFGQMIIIRHSKDYLTVYAHNDRLSVTEGERVKKNQPIAHVGDSGMTNRTKLYFEARLNGRKVNADQLISPPK